MSKTSFILAFVIVAVIVVAGVFYLSVQPSEEATESVKIGFMGPLTGDAASYGESIKRGVDMAVKEAGLENIEVIYEDSKCDSAEAVNAVNKLINIDKVVAIVGEVCSGATLAAAPVAEAAQVVMVSPSSASPSITDSGDYIFRVIPSDALQSEFGANLVYDKGLTKLAILYGGNEEYSVGFYNVLNKSFTDLGGEVVANETFDDGATDLRTQITKIKATKPDALYIISNSSDSASAALKQIKELGIEVMIFGSEGLNSADVIEGAGESAEGLMVTSATPGTLEFIEKHKTEYGIGPGPFAAQGYDAFTAIAMAVEGGAVTGEEIKDALNGISFNGATGLVKFDENGDVAGEYAVFVVKDGEFVSEESAMMMEDEVEDEDAVVEEDSN